MEKEENIVKRFFKSKRKIGIFILVLFVIIVIASLLWWKHFIMDDGKWDKDEKGRPSEYTNNVKISNDVDEGGITIDKDKLINEALKDLGYKDEDIKKFTDEEIIEKLGLEKKLGKKISSLDDVTAAELMWCTNDLYSNYLDNVEELEKLLNAEIITQYPKIKNNKDKDILDGIIEFERHDSEGGVKKLTYIKKSSFDAMIAANDTDVVNYFSLDDDGNAVFGVINTVTEEFSTNDDAVSVSDYSEGLKDDESKKVTYTASTITVDYKSAVSKYTMPFEYLWALLVVGRDKDFVLELADLVEDSEITISLYDNITTTVNEEVHTYKKETKTVTSTSVQEVNNGQVTYAYSSGSTESYSTDSKEYKVTHKFTYEEDNLMYDLTKANVWIVDYSKEYDFQKKKKESTDKNTVNIGDSEFVEIGSPSSTTSVDEKTKDIITVTSRYYIHKVGEQQVNTSTVYQQSYVAKTPNCKYKVEKDDENPNFVNILCKKEHEAAKRLLTDITKGGTPNWLFEILKSSDKTSNMVDLTKYLFYKVSNVNFGVTEFDFEEYETTSFQSLTASYGDYVVKTNDASSAPVVTDKKKMEEGIKKWLKNASAQKKNALSVLDTVMDCQEKYHVNAVFTFAFLRNETGIGSADTNYVNRDNNWGSWNLGHKFASPQENIITITSKMESGGIYFSKGNISVSQIGAIYCPNTSDYPTQGDGWIKNVNEYMTDLYSAMGIDASPIPGSGAVANGGKGTIGVYPSTKKIKYNLYLQGSNAPWAKEDYGNDHSMAKAGCGPTAAAIIASAYNANITPSTVRQSIVSSFGLGNHSSAVWIQSTLKKLIPNVKTEVAGYDEEKIKKCLENSGQVWFVVQHCKYTSGAHCMALIDYKETGMVYVAHGTANSRPYGWNKLSEMRSYNKYSSILYVGGK